MGQRGEAKGDAPALPQGNRSAMASYIFGNLELEDVALGALVEVTTLRGPSGCGTVQPPVREDGQPGAHTTDLSYCSRLADQGSFAHLALAEPHRRGVVRAGRVVAVDDGAPWIQGCVDYHRPDVVRIPGALWVGQRPQPAPSPRRRASRRAERAPGHLSSRRKCRRIMRRASMEAQ